MLASGIVGGIFGATSAVGEDAGVNAAIAVDIKNFFLFCSIQCTCTGTGMRSYKHCILRILYS